MGADETSIAKARRLYNAAYEFLTEKWITTHEEQKATRLHRFAHFCLLVFKSFTRNRCPSRATAMAYTTLLALVPLLAVAASITTGLLQEKGEQQTRQMIGQLVDAVVPQLKLVPKAETGTDARQQVVDSIHGFIANIHTKTLGASGIVGLIVVAIMLLASIEDTFNDIWGVTRGRNWFRRLVQYWTTISLGPIVLVAGLAVLLSSSYLKSTQQILQTWTWLHTLLFQGLLPFLLVSIAFALIYKLMPNTQVHWDASLIGGLVGGSLWLFASIFNGMFLSRVLGMTNIYGPLSTIPIFLIGLYFSWLIVLFGAQVAYAHQNRVVYVQEKKAESVSQRGREYIALRVLTNLAQRFDMGGPPPTLLELAHDLGVPSRLIGRVLQPLIDARLVLEVNNGAESAYAPARPLEAITCHHVLQTMRTGGGQELQTHDDAARQIVCRAFDSILEAERKAAGSVSLKDLLQHVPVVPQKEQPMPDSDSAFAQRRVT